MRHGRGHLVVAAAAATAATAGLAWVRRSAGADGRAPAGVRMLLLLVVVLRVWMLDRHGWVVMLALVLRNDGHGHAAVGGPIEMAEPEALDAGRGHHVVVLVHRPHRPRSVRIVQRLPTGIPTAMVRVHRLLVMGGMVILLLPIMMMLHRLDDSRVILDEWLHVCCRHGRWNLARAHGRTKRRRRRARCRDEPPAALGTPSRITAFAGCRGCSRGGSGLAAATRLVFVLGKLALMSRLLLLGQALPVTLGLLVLLTPLLTDNLGDFWICKAWVSEDHACLVVLAVENKGCWDGRRG